MRVGLRGYAGIYAGIAQAVRGEDERVRLYGLAEQG